MSDILPWANIVSAPLQGDEAVRIGGVRSCGRAREVATVIIAVPEALNLGLFALDIRLCQKALLF